MSSVLPAIEPGWSGFVIDQRLEFSMIGVIAGIAELLARNKISLMAMSTFDTDYFFVKQEEWERASDLLKQAGYRCVQS